MISQSQLTAKGSIEALIALANTDTLDTSSLSDRMDVAEGTARERLSELNDAGLVTEDADLRNGRPVRVHSATEDGRNLANSLVAILDGYAPDGSDEAAEDTTDSDDSE